MMELGLKPQVFYSRSMDATLDTMLATTKI
jgi:hypothetical protein